MTKRIIDCLTQDMVDKLNEETADLLIENGYADAERLKEGSAKSVEKHIKKLLKKDSKRLTYYAAVKDNSVIWVIELWLGDELTGTRIDGRKVIFKTEEEQ